METLRQIHFIPPAPFLWAERIGAFARHGVTVEAVQTASSDEMGDALRSGVRDVGIGVMDNAVGWGDALVVVAQLEARLPMRFMAAPHIATLAEAATEPIAVDATANGFVLVLYRALARAGIRREDCTFVELGGVRQRWEALEAGHAASTILVPPFDAMAEARGFRVLWDGADLVPDYPGVVAIAPRDPARAEATRRYLRALTEANAWAADPANRWEAVVALTAARHSPEAAGRLVAEAVPGLRPSAAGVAETLALRAECGLPGRAPSEVTDTRLLDTAEG